MRFLDYYNDIKEWLATNSGDNKRAPTKITIWFRSRTANAIKLHALNHFLFIEWYFFWPTFSFHGSQFRDKSEMSEIRFHLAVLNGNENFHRLIVLSIYPRLWIIWMRTIQWAVFFSKSIPFIRFDLVVVVMVNNDTDDDDIIVRLCVFRVFGT